MQVICPSAVSHKPRLRRRTGPLISGASAGIRIIGDATTANRNSCKGRNSRCSLDPEATPEASQGYKSSSARHFINFHLTACWCRWRRAFGVMTSACGTLHLMKATSNDNAGPAVRCSTACDSKSTGQQYAGLLALRSKKEREAWWEADAARWSCRETFDWQLKDMH